MKHLFFINGESAPSSQLNKTSLAVYAVLTHILFTFALDYES
ncbi:hypothetical protein ACFOG5_08655 [Pedobacter fastidiosus]